jgi:hypothetical protein
MKSVGMCCVYTIVDFGCWYRRIVKQKAPAIGRAEHLYLSLRD